MDAKAFLMQIEKLDAMIECKLIEREQWHDLAVNITAHMDGEKVQSSGAKSRMACAVEKCVDMESEIDRVVDQLKGKKRAVTDTIEQLDSPTFYKVLHMKYVQYKTLQEIAGIFDRNYEWAKTVHGRALSQVQRLLEE